MPAAMLVPMSGLWVGSVADAEMALALQWAGEQLALQQVACCEEALQQTAGADGPQTPAAVSEPAAPPSLILLPMSWSGEVTRQMLIRLARCWPLAVLVVVVGSGVDGWRRRGPSLPGAVPVPWYELPGRLQMWSEQRAAGRVGGWEPRSRAAGRTGSSLVLPTFSAGGSRCCRLRWPPRVGCCVRGLNCWRWPPERG